MTLPKATKIFDNIDQKLVDALLKTLRQARRADFCIGFFRLSGWGQVADAINHFAGGDDACCRVLIGMSESPDEELRRLQRQWRKGADELDLARAAQLKTRVAQAFRTQLVGMFPTNADERALCTLRQQIQAGKVQVKLHLSYNLHAKLYLAFRDDADNPVTAYLGSSNLTMSGLRVQGELNTKITDVLDNEKLAAWFVARWEDDWSVDLSRELLAALDESWAGVERQPYHIYLKMAYHLAEEARAGLNEFTLPHDFRGKLFDFQEAAVKIAARHLNERGGVLLGDVVGLGKTMMASALIRIFRDDFNLRPVIVCPKNLVAMWEQYDRDWDLGAKIVPFSMVQREFPNLPPRYKLIVVDESHTLRNPEGRRYRALADYIHAFGERECKVILLSATPYNKSYLDLSAQLRLFLTGERNLGIQPDVYLKAGGDTLLLQAQVQPRTLRAFELSPHADDWRELMRLFMVRRTRSFIKEHYATLDAERRRYYLELADQAPFYFPERVPRTVAVAAHDPDDPYQQLYASPVVEAIGKLALPRYGLANYLKPKAPQLATASERPLLDNLSRAGKRLMGFCRTNLFKRLESGGAVFLQSLDRHILRNAIVLHALEHDLPLPLGTQAAEWLALESDQDAESEGMQVGEEEEDVAAKERKGAQEATPPSPLAHNVGEGGQGGEGHTWASYQQRAAQSYALYAGPLQSRFRWLRPALFTAQLKADLRADAEALLQVLARQGQWLPAQDRKLTALIDLVRGLDGQKVLIFTQFADSVNYVVQQLRAAGIVAVEGVTGQSDNPTELVQRFSPISNGVTNPTLLANPIHVLVATDVLSEGQNLQDCNQVVNYDLPWAIIRLIQRVGRVDRIGQQADTVFCHTFLPADGIEAIIRLRARVRQRLQENGEVVGTDEQFFEDADQEQERRLMQNLYTESAGALDEEEDSEVDLASYAYQIWRNAVAANPQLKRIVEELPNVVYSARRLDDPSAPMRGLPFLAPKGVLVYLKSAAGTDTLAWIDEQGQSVTQAQYAILRAAECTLQTAAAPRAEQHHELVQSALALVEAREMLGGALGSPRGARRRLYEKLTAYRDDLAATAPLLLSSEIERIIDDIYRYPLRQAAADAINRQLRSGASAEQLAELAKTLRDEQKLCLIQSASDDTPAEPQVVCSLGLV
ncbi:MAG: NgoFVII family restriction endonuclease [Candidatus Viridilinea halotolerans]|uniref:NgoFVII family restriction endonuclease n=1 Tax=Candidatus Viridilinea halotolerans TaxID=2491704 RepID=A0A426TUJ4_9CHLR|nr:MAG: NgoFVII family restriction endonuclease [Candidatus Viridilinea halotolerans]